MKPTIRLKCEDDIHRIRDAGRIIADIFALIKSMDIVGISTWELDSFIDNHINRNKARSAFKTINGYNHASCISINDEVMHGIPTKKRKIKTGDIIKIDIGVALKGYFSDACYTFYAGTIDPETERLLEIARSALNRGIEALYPGKKTGDIGYSIERYISESGYSIVKQYTGHGVGFSLHEAPKVPHFGQQSTGITLQEGLVLAIEPIINQGAEDVRMQADGWTVVTADGKLSAQFEHTVAITAHGPEILTALS